MLCCVRLNTDHWNAKCDTCSHLVECYECHGLQQQAAGQVPVQCRRKDELETQLDERGPPRQVKLPGGGACSSLLAAVESCA